ncbi:hypothetical protein BDV93DRAFT_526495 [Ceratobasidium sp. AG-I]|nr:hypothetical protein BDV93DRAFT_526495 [Ceratobasidium sp. AG-I]
MSWSSSARMKPSVCSALFVIAQLIGYSTGLPTTTLTTNDPSCVFSVSPDNNTSLEYNLCPLLNQDQYQVSRLVETPPSRTKIHYDISIQHGLAWDGTLPARDQCEKGTSICMTVISERPDHRLEPPRTIYVVPVAGNIQDRKLNTTFKIGPQTDSSGRAPLKVVFHGGMYMGISQKAIFTFHCDPSAKEPSEPTLTSHGDPLEDQGKHRLSWTSRHACPIGGYPKQPIENPPSTPPSAPPAVPAPKSSSLSTSIIFLVILVAGSLIFKNSKRRLFVRRAAAPTRSLALSHLSVSLHHEADSRSPLSPKTDDANSTRNYTSLM